MLHNKNIEMETLGDLVQECASLLSERGDLTALHVRSEEICWCVVILNKK